MSNNVKKKVTFTVQGEPASKANQRKIVVIKGKTRVIRSDKARNYAAGFHAQCPNLEEAMTGDVRVTLDMFYASRRPDLDESIVLDCMQTQYTKHPLTQEKVVLFTGIYVNDRQVKEKHVFWHLDPEHPRVVITVEEL